MKKILNVRRATLYILALCTFLVNCTRENGLETPGPEINIGCHVSAIFYENIQQDEFGKVIARTKETVKHKFNEKSLLIATDQTSESWENEIPISKRIYHNENKFDTDGFLTENNSVADLNAPLNGQMVLIKTNTATKYQYSNQKLVEISAVLSEGSEQTSSSKQKFEYKGDQLLKKVLTTGSNQTTSLFKNGILTSYIESNPASKQKISVNELGFQRVVESDWPGVKTENRNTYDQAGNLTKAEFYINSVLSSYSVYEYGTSNLQGKAQFKFKGHPEIPSIIGSNANILKKTESYARKDTEAGFRKVMEMTFDYDYSPLGFYTTLRTKGRFLNEEGKVFKTSKGTQVINYVGCP